MEKEGFWTKFQQNFTEIAGKIAANKLLLTLRDSFVLVASTTMIAGFALLIQSVVLDPINGLVFGQQGLHLGQLISGSETTWEASGIAHALTNAAGLIGLVSNGSLSIFSLLLVVIFSYEFSKKYFSKSKEHLTSVLYALGAFFISLPWEFSYTPEGSKKAIDVLSHVDTTYFGTQGVFSALLISAAAVFIYNYFMQKNITIKMPDSVPPAVARSFESLVPGIITMGFFIIVTGISTALTKQTIPALLLTVLQQPAMAVAKTGLFAFVAMLTWPLLQWFGIHPTSIWGPIFGLTWNINDTQNMLGQAHHIFSTLFMNFTVIASGSFALAPVLAMLLFSKRVSTKKIGKIAIMPALFNISEPITFGLPIIMNPIYLIPLYVQHQWLSI
jgi:PTS system cellobiose-specific IIC component